MKRLLLPALLVCCFLHAYCQHPHSLKIGIKAGYDHADINAKDINGYPSGFTGNQFYAGLFVSKQLHQKFGVGTEALYSYADEYHFIEFPIYATYKIAEKWNVLLGPRIDHITDSSDKRYYHFTRWGISAEAGLQYHFSKHFFAETRYARSFTSQVDDFDLEFNNGKRNTFRIGLGAHF